MKRYGMSLPINGVPLNEHKDWIREMVDLGYTDLWGSEAGGRHWRSLPHGHPRCASGSRSFPRSRAVRRFLRRVWPVSQRRLRVDS